MIYVYEISKNMSLVDILENSNNFFVVVENEQDLITNITNNTKSIFFIDYKDIIGNKSLQLVLEKNPSNNYIILLSNYVEFKNKPSYKIIKKPYSVQEIVNTVNKIKLQ